MVPDGTEPPGCVDADRDSHRIDRDVHRRAVAVGDEVLVDLVRDAVGDAEQEGRGRTAHRADEQQPEDRVRNGVRELPEHQVPDAEAGAEPGDRGEREDERRPGDDRQPERHDPGHGVPS
jgi:hypothetical protein